MRYGNFTSSNIWKLVSIGSRKMTDVELIEYKKENPKSMAKTTTDINLFSEAGNTYIRQKKREIMLGRNLQKERAARPTSWGKLIETRVFNLLETEYILCSDERDVHPEYERWTGAKDLLTESKVCDVKCPFSLDVYCDKADIMIENDVEKLKSNFPENYWQLVSNSILTGKPIAELIIYCPYLKELVDIKHELHSGELDYPGNLNDIAWINWADDSELPYLLPDKHYKNMYKMEWKVSQEDKDFLTQRVSRAIELVNI